MKKIVLLGALMCLLILNVSAQEISGTVKDAQSGEPLEYVNVGIIGKNAGTVTDSNGQFKLPLNDNNADSLKISMIGYVPKTYAVKDYVSGSVISLPVDNRRLAEVTITGKKLKLAVLGNLTRSTTTDAGFTTNELGHEIGAIIKIKKSPTYLKQFNAALAHEATDSIKVRLNFYTVKNGLPDKIIQGQNIFVTIKKGQQDISVDLTPYNIVVSDNFFAGIEWIQNSKGSGLMFSASLLSSPIITRETSQANWEKLSLVGLGFNVLVAY